jgi:hypothetical protein
MLIAILLVLLEFELEASIATQIAQYIQVVTIRVKTRYIVEQYKPGMLKEGAI